MPDDEDIEVTIEDAPEEVAVESEKSAEQPPEGFVHRYWMVGLGLLLAVIGIAGMLALRLNITQVYIFGDSNPYTGIGTAEPLGHFVSLVPFTLGIILVIVWGIRTKPLPNLAERSNEGDDVQAAT